MRLLASATAQVNGALAFFKKIGAHVYFPWAFISVAKNPKELGGKISPCLSSPQVSYHS